MKKVAWVVKAVKVNGEIKELGDTPMGGLVFEDGKPSFFVSYDGIVEVEIEEISEVLDPDMGWMTLVDFLGGDFEDFLENFYEVEGK